MTQPGFKTLRQDGKSDLCPGANLQQDCQVSCWAPCCQHSSQILYKNEGDAMKVQCKMPFEHACVVWLSLTCISSMRELWAYGDTISLFFL